MAATTPTRSPVDRADEPEDEVRAVTRRRPGRPRDEGAREAILSATLELLAEIGFANVTVDAVAQRAGVGKATIYRRWDSKERLVVDAITSNVEVAPLPDTGSVEGDLRELFGAMATHLAGPEARSLMASMLALAAVDDEIAARLNELVRTRKQSSRTVLRHAVQRGELPSGLDYDLVVDMIAGSIVYRTCFAGDHVSPARVAATVRAALKGASPD